MDKGYGAERPGWLGMGCELNCVPKKMVPVNVTLFGNKVSADVAAVIQVDLNPVTDVFITERRGRFGYKDINTHREKTVM